VERRLHVHVWFVVERAADEKEDGALDALPALAPCFTAPGLVGGGWVALSDLEPLDRTSLSLPVFDPDSISWATCL
jgi:hypothetical protein